MRFEQRNCVYFVFIQAIIVIELGQAISFGEVKRGYDVDATSPIPVVLWHGMGDFYCSPWSMEVIKAEIKRKVPGIYVHSVEVSQLSFLNRKILCW